MSTTGRRSEVPLGAFQAWGSYKVSPVFKMMDISKALEGGYFFTVFAHRILEHQEIDGLAG